MACLRAVACPALAVVLLAWGAGAPAAVQILPNKVAGELYLVNVWGGEARDQFAELSSLATAISATGEIVGHADTGTTIGFRAPASTRIGGQYRATAIQEAGLSTIRPLGVNSAGTIVGDAARRAPPGSPSYAFKDDPAISNGTTATPVDGPLKPLVPVTSAALAVNDGGQIVGSDEQKRAFLYGPAAGGSFTVLAEADSAAVAINASGKVVGWRDVAGQRRAFLYDGATRDLLPSVEAASVASAINAGGDVAGSITTPKTNALGSAALDADTQAFLLRAGTSAHVSLGVAKGFDDSVANGVNANKWVVGQATGTGTTAQTAWLWVDGQLFDLSKQLDWDWVDPTLPNNQRTPGWLRLLTASAVNDSGMIVGQGMYQMELNSKWIEVPRAFALSVTGVPAIPEPGVYLMLLSGLMAIGVVRLRRLGAH